MGTASYMSPEQASGRTVDGRSDLWSLGVLLFQAITGELPFRGENEQAIMYAIVHETPASLRELAPDLPEALIAIVERCLDKNPERRFATAGELRVALRQVLHALPSGELTTITTATPVSVRRLTARNRRRLLLAATVVAALVVAVAGGLLLRRWLATSPLPADKHIVFLAAEAADSGTDSQDLGAGLTELIAAKAAGLRAGPLGSLWVVPPAELRQRNVTSADQARRELGATLAVTSRVERTGEIVRIELALLDPGSGRVLRNQWLQDRIANLPALQDEPALRLADMLGAALDDQARHRLAVGDTAVPVSFELFLRGLGQLQRAADPATVDGAIVLLSRATTEDALHARAWIALSEAYRRKAELAKETRFAEQAREAAAKAVEAAADLPAAHVALGDALEALDRHRDAVQAFAQGVRLAPQEVETYWKLARAHEALGELNEAVKAYETTIYVRPDYWAGYNALGMFYHRQGRYEAAVTQFRRVVEVTPENPRGYNNLGGLYMYLGRWPEARDVFERALAIGPWRSAYSNLGTLYFLDSRFGDAAKMYEQALRLDETDYVVWGNLGAAYIHADQSDRAAWAYRRAIELAQAERAMNAEDLGLVVDIAGYYGMLGEREKGLALLGQALAAPVDDPDLMARVGLSYEDLDDRESAVDWITKALEGGYSRSLLELSPGMRELRADPRITKLLTESNSDLR
jgi:serine/threonine-protein kinase